MRIINNTPIANHHKRIVYLAKQSTELFITSPFLTTDFCTLINNKLLNKLKKITLVTTLVPKSQDQIKKVYALYSLITNYKSKKALYIYFDNKLHAKVYLFKKNNILFSGVITSANFTFPGLNKNHEIGIELKSNKVLKKIETMILTQPTIEEFDNRNIFDMKNEVDDFLQKNKKPPAEKIKLDLSKFLKNKSNTSSFNYWLKPIGVTEDPVTEDQLFNQKELGLYFSTEREPTGVNIGDIMIANGVGSTNILSVYEVISKSKLATDKEVKRVPWKKRWRWYVMGKNLTPKYGKVWAKKDLKLSTLQEEFNHSDSTGILTAAGGKTLGALNYGHDRLKLRKEFAEYIIGRVNQYNT